MKHRCFSRRDFLKRSIMGTAGMAVGWRVASLGGTASAVTYTSQVAITKGNDRADNAFRVMQFFKKQIAQAIANKKVILKANVTGDTNELANTHVDWLEGILEFLKSIGRTDVIIAECNPRNTMRAYENMGYFRLLNKYPVKLVELGGEGADLVQVWRSSTESTFRTIRVSRLLRNPNNFVISCPRIKTHNNGVATMGIKNVIMGSPMVDPGFFWGQVDSTKFNKTPGMHGDDVIIGPYQSLNDNIYRLAKVYGIHPHLSVIDGYQGMERNGPGSVYPAARQYLGIASFDWVAADRVCLKLMGGDAWYTDSFNNTEVTSTINLTGVSPLPTMDYPMFPAYMNYCWRGGLGEWDITKIEILGEPISGNIIDFIAHDEVRATQTDPSKRFKQLKYMRAVSRE